MFRKHLDYAKALADSSETLVAPTTRISGVTQQMLTTYLDDPVSSFEDISKLMNILYTSNGIIKRNVNYYSTMLTLNHSIYPTMNEKSGMEVSDEDMEDYVGAANFIEDLDVKRYVPYFISQTLKNGYSLFYKIQDNKGVAYMEFPIQFGRIYSIENGVYRWAVDIDALEKIPDENLPPEMVQARGSADREGEDWFKGKYFKLKEKGVAFTFDQSVLSNGGVAVSEFTSLIAGAIRLENARNKLEIKDSLDGVKLIHSQIPVDKEGMPQMDAKIAAKYDKSMKRSLPKGVVPITNPMKVTNIALNGAGDTKAYESVDRATTSLFYDMGTPSAMFGGSTTSSNIVKISNTKDIAWAYGVILPVFESYYNSEMSKYKSKKGFRWKMRIMRQTVYTFGDDIKNAKEQLTLGGSRMDFLAMNGMSPLEIVGKLMLEQRAISIDMLMIPKQTSHTMPGGGKGGEGVGRPTSDDPTDDTDRLNDAN